MRVHAGIQAAIAALVTTTALAGSSGVAQAAAAHHLYVAIDQSSGALQVLRYPLVNGLPERTPDLTYNNVSLPMAIAPDGTFYATVPLACCFGEAQILAFPPNSSTPTREVTLPVLSDTTVATALAVARDGHMYVGYDAFISGVGTRWPAPETGGHIPFHGIAVYPPGADGSGPPATAYKFPGISGGPSALVAGPENRLWASGYNLPPRQGPTHGYIFEIVKPWEGPNVVGHLALGQVDVTGMAFSDETRELYALEFGYPDAKILVFPRGQLGQHGPKRAITIQNNYGELLGIAGENVFISGFAAQSGAAEVRAYSKHANGSPKPNFLRIYQPPVASSEGVLIGP